MGMERKSSTGLLCVFEGSSDTAEKRMEAAGKQNQVLMSLDACSTQRKR